MKRWSLNIILVVVFSGLVLLVADIYVSDRIYDNAESLQKQYRWTKSFEKYRAAIKVMPLNARYWIGFGDFLMRRTSVVRSDTVQSPEKAYERACLLNPKDSEAWYKLGAFRTKAIREDAVRGRIITKMLVDSVMECFRTAIKADPYSLRINYFVGYELLTIWKQLSDEDKHFVERRLKIALKVNHWYASNIYPEVMFYTNDFDVAEKITPRDYASYRTLYSFVENNHYWKYRKRIADETEKLQQEEDSKGHDKNKLEKEAFIKFVSAENKEKWVGQSKIGKKLYNDGNLYWNGSVGKVIDIPVGSELVSIMAKGAPADDVWPYMIVEVDEEEIGEIFVSSDEWVEYIFKIGNISGRRVISVTFINDGSSKDGKEDRNLYVGDVTVR